MLVGEDPLWSNCLKMSCTDNESSLKKKLLYVRELAKDWVSNGLNNILNNNYVSDTFIKERILLEFTYCVVRLR